MPFSPLEIAIVAIILLVFFGSGKLPALGRAAGNGLRELKDAVGGMAKDHDVTPDSLGRQAGKGVREFKELKASFSADDPKAKETAAKPRPAAKTEPQASSVATPQTTEPAPAPAAPSPGTEA